MFREIAISILLIIGSVFAVYFSIAGLRVLWRFVKTGKMNGRYKFKRHIKHFLYHFLEYPILFFFDFVKLVIFDLIVGKDRVKIFGLWAFTGYFGQGKTLGMVHFAKNLQKKYPHKDIKLFSNFALKGQVKKIESWEDLLDLPPNSIVLLDEAQSSFQSAKMSSFPVELLWKITQCRKKQLMILYTSPVFHRMEIRFRENTDFIIECKNILKLDRWFAYTFYHAAEYEAAGDSTVKKLLAKQFSINIIPTKRLFRSYDTTQTVDRFDVEGDKKGPIKDYTKLKNDILKELEFKLKRAAG